MTLSKLGSGRDGRKNSSFSQSVCRIKTAGYSLKAMSQEKKVTKKKKKQLKMSKFTPKINQIAFAHNSVKGGRYFQKHSAKQNPLQKMYSIAIKKIYLLHFSAV